MRSPSGGWGRVSGIVLGLTNLYLERLTRKGYLETTSTRRRRVRHWLTLTGAAQRTRLAYDDRDRSRRLYRETRMALRQKRLPLVQRGRPADPDASRMTGRVPRRRTSRRTARMGDPVPAGLGPADTR